MAWNIVHWPLLSDLFKWSVTMGSLKRAALGGSTITFISRRQEVPRSSRPARSFPRHSGMQTGLLGLVPALRLPSRHRLRFTEAESSRRGKCGAGDPAKRLRAGPPKPHAHASRAHPVGSCRWLTGALALLGRLPCGGRCRQLCLTFGFSPPLPFAPSLPLPMPGHRTWSP